MNITFDEPSKWSHLYVRAHRTFYVIELRWWKVDFLLNYNRFHNRTFFIGIDNLIVVVAADTAAAAAAADAAALARWRVELKRQIRKEELSHYDEKWRKWEGEKLDLLSTHPPHPLQPINLTTKNAHKTSLWKRKHKSIRLSGLFLTKFHQSENSEMRKVAQKAVQFCQHHLVFIIFHSYCFVLHLEIRFHLCDEDEDELSRCSFIEIWFSRTNFVHTFHSSDRVNGESQQYKRNSQWIDQKRSYIHTNTLRFQIVCHE